MSFAAAEGRDPLEDLDWSEHYSFPKELLQVGVYKSDLHQFPQTFLIVGFSGSGRPTAVSNCRQLAADLQVPGVPGDGGRSFLRHELRP